jgi:CDP-diglyceride synthetase
MYFDDTKYIDTLLSSYAYVCHNDTKYIDTLLSSHTCVSQWHKEQWHIVISVNVLCVVVTHRYKMITMCHVFCAIMTHMYKMITIKQRLPNLISLKWLNETMFFFYCTQYIYHARTFYIFYSSFNHQIKLFTLHTFRCNMHDNSWQFTCFYGL